MERQGGKERGKEIGRGKERGRKREMGGNRDSKLFNSTILNVLPVL